MIDGIRRRLGKPIDEDPWDTGQEFAPEVSETNELPTDAADLVAATRAIGEYVPAAADTPDYYSSLVSTAIKNGGKYGDHRISIPWLRMILAGLEMKRVNPESMWRGVETGTAGSPLPEIPSYEDLFPAERDAPTAPGAA